MYVVKTAEAVCEGNCQSWMRSLWVTREVFKAERAPDANLS